MSVSVPSQEIGLDEPIRLSQASKFFPGNPSVNTLRRWSKAGYRGVRLSTFRSGRFACTTKRRIADFHDGCTAAHEASVSDTPQDRADEAALDSLGV